MQLNTDCQNNLSSKEKGWRETMCFVLSFYFWVSSKPENELVIKDFLLNINENAIFNRKNLAVQHSQRCW